MTNAQAGLIILALATFAFTEKVSVACGMIAATMSLYLLIKQAWVSPI